jgi:hypothetical protein
MKEGDGDALFGDPLPAALFSLPTPLCLVDVLLLQPTPPSPLCPLAPFSPFHRPVAGFAMWRVALTVLFILPGVAEGQGYYQGNYHTNLCPVGSEQVLSVSAHSLLV